MYPWHAGFFAIAWLILVAGSAGAAPQLACALDLNGDGNVSAQGETAACRSTAGGRLCPIAAQACTTAQTCPLDERLACANGACTLTGSCQTLPQTHTQTVELVSRDNAYAEITTSFTIIRTVSVSQHYSRAACVPGSTYGWNANVLWVNRGCHARFDVTGESEAVQCSLTGARYATLSACTPACVQTAACTAAPPVCPLGNHACLEVSAGNFQCSANPCVDLKATPPVTTGLDSRLYIDDGARDASGACLDQIMIFAGRNLECRPPGVETAFKNCCANRGKVLLDSTGSIAEAQLAGTAVVGAWKVASAAWAAYQASGSAASAAAAGSNAALVAFDPATLAASLVVMLVMDYLQNACDAMDMETGLLNGSGYCYETGRYCKTDWPFAGCIQHAKTFCCFNSKLARLIHEQGRPQLASFNGVAANDCRGFLPEEFQYLDFSRIDLSDYTADLHTAPLSLVEEAISHGVHDVYRGLR